MSREGSTAEVSAGAGTPPRWTVRLRRAVSGALRRRPATARYLYHRYLRKRAAGFSDPPVLIYQMGKVGSKSVRASLRARDLSRPVFHVHFLDRQRVRDMERERRRFLGTQKEHLLRHIWQYMYLNRELDREDRKRPWKIITMTRDPVARNVSTFFENLETEPLKGARYRVFSSYYEFDIVIEQGETSLLRTLFFERVRHDTPLKFFDHELKRHFGIDVYGKRFPVAKGYETYRSDEAQVLLIRLEDLNRCAGEAFRRFLDLEDFSITSSNVSSEKPYASIFSEFKKSMVFPAEYVDAMYNSKYARHFYSEDEIRGFRAGLKIQ